MRPEQEAPEASSGKPSGRSAPHSGHGSAVGTTPDRVRRAFFVVPTGDASALCAAIFGEVAR